MTKLCKDCPPGAPRRPAPYPGPRCATHHREAQRRRKAQVHDAHVSRTFGVSRGFYDQLRALQQGVCAICRRANGRTKRLAVDHDHRTGDPRGLLCGPCNQVVGVWSDDPETFRRGARYLEAPPAAQLLLAADDDPGGAA